MVGDFIMFSQIENVLKARRTSLESDFARCLDVVSLVTECDQVNVLLNYVCKNILYSE